MNLPNRLTLLRVALVPLFLVLCLVAFPFHYTVALAVFGAAAFTDFLDGRIARKQGLVTDFGKFLDPIADKLLTTAALLVFLAQGCLDVWAVMLVLAREFMVTSVRLMAAGDGTVVAASFAGKLKTVAQYIAIIAMLLALQWRELCVGFGFDPLWSSLPILAAQILLWVSVVLTCWSGVQYLWEYRRYFSADR